MALRIEHITFDCVDPQQLASFWASALGRRVDDGASPFFASIGKATADGGVAMLFLAVPEAKSSKNRVHLDTHGDDRETEVLRLVSLGASRVAEKDEWGTRWTVMLDPEGNEFCVAS